MCLMGFEMFIWKFWIWQWCCFEVSLGSKTNSGLIICYEFAASCYLHIYLLGCWLLYRNMCSSRWGYVVLYFLFCIQYSWNLVNWYFSVAFVEISSSSSLWLVVDWDWLSSVQSFNVYYYLLRISTLPGMF